MNEKTNSVLLSICIPTNGVTEWVIPVLDSIFDQQVDIEKFEVIISDNGSNIEFKNAIQEYISKYNNIIYQENNSYMFHNQLEALKLGHGTYLKFFNHRAVLTDGSLSKMLAIISENIEEKPTLYFSNGTLNSELIECFSFDSFVSKLGIYASWTTGVGIWKEEFDRIKNNLVVDRISPHSCVLFSRRHDNLYKIYNYVFSREITSDHSKKGTYDLFKAFGIEELAITQNLYLNDDITIKTFKEVKKQYEDFLAKLYFDFCIRKKPCSYDITGFDNSMGIYFRKSDVVKKAYFYGARCVFKKIFFRPKIV